MRSLPSLVLCAVLLGGVGAAPSAAASARKTLKLATTTSTENSGLLDQLLPAFTRQTGIAVQVIAVGTGKALKLGENGDVDVVMVHAREAEDAFVAAGFGVDRRDVMKNDFLLVGPPADPAGLKAAGTLEAALQRLKGCAAPFVSRGDDSGTHLRERALWAAVRGPPAAAGCHLEIGQGMGATLRMAHEKHAYTLTDRGTFLALRKTLSLVPVFEGDPRLDNPYGVIAVNPRRHGHVQYTAARRLIDWLTSAEGQHRIGAFRVDGAVLFHPTAAPPTGK